MCIKRFFHLVRSNDGITAIEFAIIVPVFLMFVMGLVEFSMIMFTLVVMESATANTARLGSTGYVAAGTTRAQEIISNVQTKTAGLLNPAKLTITSESYATFNEIGQPEPCIKPTTPPCPGTPGVNFTDINGNGVWDADMGTAGQGNAGDVVVYTVSYPWPIMTPIISAVIGKTITLTSRAVVRNEPYN